MRKYILVLIITLSSCVNSKITTLTAFPKIVAGEGILFLPTDNLSLKSGYIFYEIAKKRLVETNTVLFLPEQEYVLIGKGIDREELYKKEIPNSTKTAICEYTNTRYILKMELLSSKKGSNYGSYTENETKNNYYGTINRETNMASMLFTLTDTKEHLTEYKFNINTTISPLSINEGNGGERNVNLSTEFGAISESFKKGIKKLKKEIIKN